MASLTRLEALLVGYPSLLVGYSGGVDSALLAVVARRVLGKERSLAVMGLSDSYPRVQRERARAIAQTYDLELLELVTDELADPHYVANGPDRCYFCKRELWSKLCAVARQRSIAVVADGTNADDLGDHRPGLRAAAERRIVSPLAEAGLAKADVRQAARALGIPVWDAPASPCLSSRVMYGLAVTPSRLRQVEEGEDVLRQVGVRGDLRVRHRGREARIEVLPSEFDLVRKHGSHIADRLLDLGFDRVTLDVGGYRRGSQLDGAEPHLELLAQRG